MNVFLFKFNRCVPVAALLLVFATILHGQQTTPPRQLWTEAQADAWYATQPWPVGANFLPTTAINELEMWQADTFDAAAIDRELGRAEGLA
jgi:hypothetical protein